MHDLGVAVEKNEEGLYTFLYKNEEIASSLSKSEVESYLKDLFSKTRKSADEATAYLDDLAETVKLRKAAFTKWASKFEKKFHIHFDGEFTIGKLSNRDATQVLKGTGGHNHSVIGENIQIRKELTAPVNDKPFDALIEVRYKNGQWIEKQAKSSMFPKNWNIQRVKEEIAFVYEEMIKDGFELQFKNNKYKAFNSNHNFEIN